jgi:hypothetical protein
VLFGFVFALMFGWFQVLAGAAVLDHVRGLHASDTPRRQWWKALKPLRIQIAVSELQLFAPILVGGVLIGLLNAGVLHTDTVLLVAVFTDVVFGALAQVFARTGSTSSGT